MARTADVVIIGGGINGASIAYQLAIRGVKNVVLVEKGHIASGPTARSSGIIRQHYTLPVLTEMARDSLRVFENFGDAVGGDAGFRRSGAVFMGPPGLEAGLRANVTMHNALGIREELLSAADLRAMEPDLVTDDIAVAAFEPEAGYADPALAANSYAEAAMGLGVEILRRTRVTGLRVDGGRVAGVITDQTHISTRVVVNVAGPWGAEIAAMVGVHIPMFASRHPVIILHRPAEWRTPTPIWFDMIRGFYYKPEHGAGFMAGTLDEATHHAAVDVEAHTTAPEYTEVETLSDATLKRFPVMESGTVQGGWAGLYDVTPDSQPVIDRIDEVEGFYCAVGFSGHGFKLAPSVGVILAESILTGRSSTYDIEPFRHARFREGRAGKPAYEYSVIG